MVLHLLSPSNINRSTIRGSIRPTKGGCACRDEVVPAGYGDRMVSFVKSVTFDCADPMRAATFWAAALGSNVDEDSTPERAWVEPPGWGGPNLWFRQVPESKTAKNRQHFDLRVVGDLDEEVARLVALGATEVDRRGDLVVMTDPEGNEFCVEV